jgi:hypothetical protein
MSAIIADPIAILRENMGKLTKALEIKRATAARNTVVEIGSLLVCMDRSFPLLCWDLTVDQIMRIHNIYELCSHLFFNFSDISLNRIYTT